jgi:hypothetical protein
VEKVMEEQQIEMKEKELLERARNWWDEVYPRDDATDLAKMRIYSREGLVQGKFEHDVKKAWYKKQGYWEDGKTTLEERKKQLRLKKIEFGKKIDELQTSYTENLDEIIKNIQLKKKQIEDVPQIIKQDYAIERNQLLIQIRGELETLRSSYLESIEKEVTNIYEGMINDFETRKNELFLKGFNKLETMYQQSKWKIETEINSYGAELEAELNILDSSKHDDHLLEEYNEEVKKINQELAQLQNSDGDIQKPKFKVEVEKPKPKELWVCPYCPDEEKRPFGNKGGLGGHISGKHGKEKWEEYKALEKEREVEAL